MMLEVVGWLQLVEKKENHFGRMKTFPARIFFPRRR